MYQSGCSNLWIPVVRGKSYWFYGFVRTRKPRRIQTVTNVGGSKKKKMTLMQKRSFVWDKKKGEREREIHLVVVVVVVDSTNGHEKERERPRQERVNAVWWGSIKSARW